MFSLRTMSRSRRTRRRLGDALLALPLRHCVESPFQYEISIRGACTGSSVTVIDSISGQILIDTNIGDHNDYEEVNKDLVPGMEYDVRSTALGAQLPVTHRVRISSLSRITTRSVIHADHLALNEFKTSSWSPSMHQGVLRSLYVRTVGLLRNGGASTRGIPLRLRSSMRQVFTNNCFSRDVLRFAVGHSTPSDSELRDIINNAHRPADLVSFMREGGVDVRCSTILCGNITLSRADNVKLLISGPNSTKDEYSDWFTFYPLGLAVSNAEHEIARILVDSGVDLNAVDRQGRSAIGIAVRSGDVSMVELLIGAGTSLSNPNLVHTCVIYDRCSLMNRLLKAGAAVEQGALGLACSHGDVGMVRSLLRHIGVTQGTLRMAIVDPPCVRLCVEKIFSIDAETLGFFMLHSPFQVSELLKNANVEIGAVAIDGMLRGSPVSVVEAMMKHPNFDPEFEYTGLTALMHALSHEKTGIVKLLLEIGANPNARTRVNEHSALTIAAMRSDPGTLLSLLHHGAVFHNTKFTPLRCALKAGMLGNAYTMLKHAESNHCLGECLRDGPLIIPARTGDLHTAEMLLSFGADPDDYDDDGWTATTTAARHGKLRVLKSFVRHGADLRIENRDPGGTPLNHASAKGYVDVVDYLLRFDAVRAAYDGQALFIAVNLKNFEIVERLVALPIDFLVHDQMWVGMALKRALDEELECTAAIIDAYGATMMRHDLIMLAAEIPGAVGRSARAILRRRAP